MGVNLSCYKEKYVYWRLEEYSSPINVGMNTGANFLEGH